MYNLRLIIKDVIKSLKTRIEGQTIGGEKTNFNR